jgi:hypothetical protein
VTTSSAGMSAPASTNPFRIPAFSRFFAGRLCTTLANQTQGVAVAWQVYAIARERGFNVQQSALWLGLIGLAQFLPVFVLTLPAGETGGPASGSWRRA